jgi:hypothetical protein
MNDGAQAHRHHAATLVGTLVIAAELSILVDTK